MAQKLPIEYVRFYTDGSAARKLEVAAPKLAEPILPKPQKQKRKRVYVDPLAIFGVVVAACMLFTMVVGLVRLHDVQQDQRDMQVYIAYLQQINEQKQAEYADSYDLAQVEKTALALGMVPSSEVKHMTIDVTAPEEPEDTTLWENVGTFLAGLFA